jgi:hypothetical protein
MAAALLCGQGVKIQSAAATPVEMTMDRPECSARP